MKTNVERLGLFPDREAPGFFLWLERNGRPLAKSDQLLFKQRLFRHDEPSFFGTAFPLVSGEDMDGKPVTGTVIPFERADLLAGQHPEALQVKQAPVPGRFGSWQADLPDLPVIWPDSAACTGNPADVLFAGYTSEALEHLSADPDERIRRWTAALRDPGETYELPLHLYQFCLGRLGIEDKRPFQFALAVHEPDLFSDDWKVEIVITETKTRRTATLSEVTAGHHPFIHNPVMEIKEKVQRLAAVPGLEPFSSREPVLVMDDEAVYTLLQDFQTVCEQAGIAVLVPQSWERTVAFSLTGEVSPSPSGRGAEIDWFFSHHHTTLSEEQIREWVEEQRRFIQFENRWMRWDLQKAERYLKEINRIKNDHHASLFQAIQEIVYMPGTENDESSADDDETIRLSVSPHWFEAVRSTTSPNLHSRWKPMLKPYQIEGVEWLLSMRSLGLGACLADEMGLGKTVQAIAYSEHVSKAEDQPVLIVCPTSLLENWRTELARFAPELDVTVYYGSPAVRAGIDLKKSDVVLTTYPILVKDAIFSTAEWAAVLFDEAQMIKNNRTRVWKEAKKLNAGHRIAVTGTPVENRPAELWALFDWFAEGYLGTLSSFLKRFSGDRETRLKKVIEPFVLRRTKQRQRLDWQIPDKKEVTRSCELTREQHLLYRAVVEETTESLDFLAPPERKGVFFKGLTRLKQICNHPAQYYDERRPLDGRSGKWQLFMNTIDELLSEGRRIVVFTQYRRMGHLLQQGLDEAFCLSPGFLNGSMKMKERFQLVDRFNQGEAGPVLLVSIRTGGTGLNMTGASEVIHYDRWWNPAVDRQAADRVHRIGQTKPVTIHALTTRGTVEESIEKALAQKEELYQSLFKDGGQTPVWQMPPDRLRTLFYGEE
ncbi:hypothetical protein CR205_02120 [Alteribacter lacisalsi]|uniref:ATP-dependent helicase n=1 Tax=Alteribacter lacisalsi TaxID=2045244 RepID=A0A2W0HUS6_9BACI|nr:DEAD/DEAH box helicase [Alteribacter lacisalsi]PYZ97418.1 hypothetical protein CR205_02120 [Alteribacter lacisalsi]